MPILPYSGPIAAQGWSGSEATARSRGSNSRCNALLNALFGLLSVALRFEIGAVPIVIGLRSVAMSFCRTRGDLQATNEEADYRIG
jgi:hypothetical protein